MKKILFFKPADTSRTNQDEVFLRRKYQTKSFTFNDKNLYRSFDSLVKQGIFLYRNIKSVSVIYIWQADFHALLPLIFCKLFKRKSILIIGGYDAVNIKEIQYGAHVSFLRSLVIKLCCSLSTKILPVSSYVLKNLVQNIKSAHPLKTKIVYDGADTKEFCFDYTVEKQGVVCVSNANNIKEIEVEGLDFYAELAKSFPAVNFKVVGTSGRAKSFLQNLNIPNMELVEMKKREELKGILNQSGIICQFSRFEPFGVALTEGMLCGCIPISVKNIGPEEIISSDVGVLIEDLDLNKAKEALSKALAFPWDIRNRARFRIIKNFSLKERQQNLSKILVELEAAR